LLAADPASRVSQAAWAVLVIGYFTIAGRRPVPGNNAQARLCDVCVLLLAPLPFSIWFIPYHAIVLLPANMLLLTVALGSEWDSPRRWAAGSALAASQILQYSVDQWDLRGATSLATFALVVLALAIIRKVPEVDLRLSIVTAGEPHA
jgi:hypothetical protein